MALSSDDGLNSYYWSDSSTSRGSSSESTSRTRSSALPLLETKLRLPKAKKGVVRSKLIELLERSIQNHAATLLVGRAGSGKTELAAAVARRVGRSAWCTIDAGDSDWQAFSRYFQAMFFGKDEADLQEKRTPLELLASLTTEIERRGIQWPKVLVLDGVDHLFDTDWYREFSDALIASVPPGSHVLILCRTKPPTPLWRLRAKQVVNVVDEKVLAFSLRETEELFALNGRSCEEAAAAQRESYGRVGSLVQILSSYKSAGRTR